MPRFFRPCSGKEMVKVLGKIGFLRVSQKGSHMKVKRNSGQGTEIIVVPDHRELTPGTFRSVLKTAGLSIEEFIKLKS